MKTNSKKYGQRVYTMTLDEFKDVINSSRTKLDWDNNPYTTTCLQEMKCNHPLWIQHLIREYAYRMMPRPVVKPMPPVQVAYDEVLGDLPF